MAFFDGKTSSKKVSMGGTNNRFISRAERLSRARQERERREKTRKDAAAALQIQRVFRGRWVAKTVRDTFRALFDKRAGDLQKVSLILKATGKEFVPPLHVLSPLVQSFNFFHCYSPERDRPRILLLCNFLWASFGAKDKRVNYRSLAGSAGCPSMPWVFQVSTFLRSALGLLVFTDNRSSSFRLVLDLVNLITGESSWGEREENNACDLVLLHLLLSENFTTKYGESLIQVLIKVLKEADTIENSFANGGGGEAAMGSSPMLHFQQNMCDMIVRAFSSAAKHKRSSTAITSAFEEFTRFVLPLPMLSAPSSGTRISLMKHLIHPLFQIPNMWRSCLYAMMRWVPEQNVPVDYNWIFANLMYIVKHKDVFGVLLRDKEMLVCHVNILAILIDGLPDVCFLSPEEKTTVSKIWERYRSSSLSSDEEGSDLFAPGQPTEANGLAGGSAKLSASTDLKKILQGHRTKRVNASLTAHRGADSNMLELVKAGLMDTAHAKAIFGAVLSADLGECSEGGSGNTAKKKTLSDDRVRVDLSEKTTMMKLGAFYNKINARSGVLVTPVLYHGPGHTILNALALQAGRTIIPQYWAALKQAVDLKRFAETGAVFPRGRDDANDGPACLNCLSDSDVEDSLCLFFTMYGNLLVALDDIDFYEKQIPFQLPEQYRLVSLLSALLHRMVWDEQPSSLDPAAYPLHRTRLVLAASNLYNKLYERNCRKSFCPGSSWEWPKVSIEAGAFGSTMDKLGVDARFRSSLLLRLIPQVMSFDHRVALFSKTLRQQRDGNYEEPGHGVKIKVRRGSLYEDAYNTLNPLKGNLKGRIQISFVDEHGIEEAGIDGGGLFKEFMVQLSKRAFDPQYGMFKEAEGGALYPSPSSAIVAGSSHLDHFAFLGRILGKAVYESILIEPQFAGFFLNKLLGRGNYVDDIKSLDIGLYQNLMQLKSVDNVADADLNFTTMQQDYGELQVVDLVPNGSNINVTNENCLQYIYSLAHYRLNRQISAQSKAFLRGFRDLIPTEFLRMFNPGEVQMLIGGSVSSFDIADMSKFITYASGYHPSQPYIRQFWEALNSFSDEDRGFLLHFWTSCSRPPLMGFKALYPPLCIQEVPITNDNERLPTAATCMNLLKLPRYSSSKVMVEKLLLSIRSAKDGGFGLS
jgi:hypothetical protein